MNCTCSCHNSGNTLTSCNWCCEAKFSQTPTNHEDVSRETKKVCPHLSCPLAHLDGICGCDMARYCQLCSKERQEDFMQKIIPIKTINPDLKKLALDQQNKSREYYLEAVIECYKDIAERQMELIRKILKK